MLIKHFTIIWKSIGFVLYNGEIHTIYSNQIIPTLPIGITNLNLGYWFNQTLPELPSAITDLNLGYDFNQPLVELQILILECLLINLYQSG